MCLCFMGNRNGKPAKTEELFCGRFFILKKSYSIKFTATASAIPGNPKNVQQAAEAILIGRVSSVFQQCKNKRNCNAKDEPCNIFY